MTSFREIEERLDLGDFAAAVAAALARSADPVGAPARAADLIEAAGAAGHTRLREVWDRCSADVIRVLAALSGSAPFLVPILTRLPELFLQLLEDDFTRARTRSDYGERLEGFLRAAARDEAALLRRFKYLELARITVRDVSADLVPLERADETLTELSHLADVLLQRALDTAAARLGSSVGPPRWRGASGEAVELGFCALGLGKLGGEELNYSSDVDLVYVFRNPPADATLEGGPSGLAPVEYFSRLAQEFGRIVGESTEEGFLYRIDLDLRPEGDRGPLVVAADELVNYYESWAATWERAAFMKARPVAGDETLGWRTIRAVDPLIYRSAMDYASVAAIREMKDKIEQAKERSGQELDVKVGAGGIRDVEFVAQALQLLHGGRIPELRGRSTSRALVALAQVGVLPEREADELLAAYLFLRRTENRLQMEAERQTHRLPRDARALEGIARGMGFTGADGVDVFERELGAHRRRTRRIFTALFPEGGSERIVTLFARSVPQLLLHEPSRRVVEILAEQFARAIDNSTSPQRALNNLERFVRGVGRRRFYYELLIDRPELVPRLVELFAASEYLSGFLATHPRLIEPIFSDPNVLLLSRQELRASLASIRASLAAEGGRDEVEAELDALRLFRNRELINIGLLDLAGKIMPADAERALTDVAEVSVEAGLELAGVEMQRRGGAPPFAQAGEFLVVGMGKLASRELTYGSDLDVLFLYDLPGAGESAEALEYYVRLAQKFIWTLQTRTSEGVSYAIDARLRPSGNQGMLVSSLASFERYHASNAQVWERQALLRARPVAGGERLGRAFAALRLEILRRALKGARGEGRGARNEGRGARGEGREAGEEAGDVGRELHRIRLRTESELARETTSRHDFKTGRGGMQDVETVVQLLQLRHGRDHAELLEADGVAVHLPRLQRLALLSADDTSVLLEGWRFLQLLSSRLRIVENRSISDLDEERGDLDAIAQRLGYTSPQREGGARRALLEDYRRHTAAIRAVYRRVLGV